VAHLSLLSIHLLLCVLRLAPTTASALPRSDLNQVCDPRFPSLFLSPTSSCCIVTLAYTAAVEITIHVHRPSFAHSRVLYSGTRLGFVFIPFSFRTHARCLSSAYSTICSHASSPCAPCPLLHNLKFLLKSIHPHANLTCAPCALSSMTSSSRPTWAGALC
jgi:hypothetical protein